MKKLIFLIVFVVLNFSIQAQKVSNIRAEQRGQEIVVLYTLETTSPCEVSLLLSQDNGVTWSDPLKNVSGAVGKSITAGEKQIIWKVLEEREQLVGDKIKFKVFASGKKSFEPEMVFVEGGTFQMGSNSGEPDEKPVHNVTISSFNIGKYEVTQAQWKEVMGNNPSYFKDCDRCPIEQVSWNEVQLYIQKLNSLTGKNYRLPTEAEWEYAAKGGKDSKGYTYSGSDDMNTVAWYYENSGGKTHTVGTRQPNELGIFDLTGNVWEWCSDWYNRYNNIGETNPKGASDGAFNVLRGGSWYGDDNECRISFRSWSNPVNRNLDYYYGFRLVLPVSDLAEPTATNDLESDAGIICEFMNKIGEAQKNSDLDKILLLQQQLEPLMSDFQRKYPKGSEDGKKMEALIKPCLGGFMDSFK
jgi:formylglycine-generating enzyme required for sulfatase activity